MNKNARQYEPAAVIESNNQGEWVGSRAKSQIVILKSECAQLVHVSKNGRDGTNKLVVIEQSKGEKKRRSVMPQTTLGSWIFFCFFGRLENEFYLPPPPRTDGANRS
jgi:hypothetical protein